MVLAEGSVCAPPWLGVVVRHEGEEQPYAVVPDVAAIPAARLIFCLERAHHD